MPTLRTAALIAALASASAGCMSDEMDDGAMSDSRPTASMAVQTRTTTQATTPTTMTPAQPPAAATAQTTVIVGGAAMYPNRNIIENAVNSADHTTLVAAVKAAGLVETLSGPGPFTVFAPTNAAFAKLPAGTVDKLTMPESKTMLQGILTYHVVPGRMTAADISKAIQAGGGKATLTTVAGGKLTATAMRNTIMLTDEKGGMSHVTIGDVMQSNGVIHVVDTVLMPA